MLNNTMSKTTARIGPLKVALTLMLFAVVMMTMTVQNAYAEVAAGSTSLTTQASSGAQNMHRLYNPNSGEHFYTASTQERDGLVKIGWRYEGTGWYAPTKSKSPVYRMYNPNSGDHHYTLSASERDNLKNIGWNYEGIGWYSDDAKSVPLYRQFNPNAVVGTHNYTTSKKENDDLARIGWHAEGIAWYGINNASKANTSNTSSTKPAHTHNYKKTWHANVVTVTDKAGWWEDGLPIIEYHRVCSVCGANLDNGGVQFHELDHGGCSVTQQKIVGYKDKTWHAPITHTEDRGWWEYICSCGAKK